MPSEPTFEPLTVGDYLKGLLLIVCTAAVVLIGFTYRTSSVVRAACRLLHQRIFTKGASVRQLRR